MRVDVFNSSDRAREARARYLDYEAGRYHSWCLGGAYWGGGVTFLSLFTLIGLHSGYVTVAEIEKAEAQEFFLMVFFWPLMGLGELPDSSQALVIAAIVSISLYYGAYRSLRLVALYQGMIYGVGAGLLGFGLAWLVFVMLKFSVPLLLPILVGVITMAVFMSKGWRGHFLPEV